MELGGDRAGMNRAITQDQLWRPAGEVLHLLTERRHPPSDPEENHSARHHPVEEELVASKRQAPAVWRPPIGMKPNCPLAPPPVVDEWQLPKQVEELASPLLVMDRKGDDPDSDRDQEQENGDSRGDLRNLIGSSSSPGDPRSLDVDKAAKNGFSAITTDVELMPAPRTDFPVPDKLFHASSPSLFSTRSDEGGKLSSPFMKQAVAQTPLFSGLGSVSFGSGAGFLQPSTGSIFAQTPPLAFGRSFHSMPDEEQQQQQRPLSSIKHMSSTNSASEKGSSDSQAGKAGLAIESNGGFKPSGLAGKSLVAEAPAKAAKSNVSSGRKLRTRPLDLLMNAIQADVPAKSTRLSSRILNASGAQLNSSPPAEDAGTGTQDGPDSSATRAPPRPTRNTTRQESIQKQQQQEQQDDRQQRKGAFFVHTGVWIVQKKSCRHTKSAFRRRSLEEEEDEEGERNPSEVQGRPGSKNRNGQHEHGTTTTKTTMRTTARTSLTKKRSLAAMTSPQQKRQPEPKQQKRNQSKVGARHEKAAKKQDSGDGGEHGDDDEQGDDGDEEDDESRVVTKAPLVRSKRGRPRSLPSRLRDSVINKVAKTTRKERVES